MHLTPQRTVRLWGDEISPDETEKLVEKIEKFMDASTEAWVTLEIYSGGGNCQAGFALCDWLVANKVHLQTVGYGVVASMAVPIFLMGEHRVMGGNCTFMLHPLKSIFKSNASFNMNELANERQDLIECHRRYVNLFSSRANGITVEQIEDFMAKEMKINALEAKRLGLVHEVVQV